MRILFVIEVMGGGGAERVTSLVASRLAALGHEVSILTRFLRNPEYPVDGRVARRNLALEASKPAHPDYPALVRGIARHIRELQPDVVVSLGDPRIKVLVTMAAKLTGKRLILSERSDPARHPPGKRTRRGRMISYLVADRVVFQTQGARDYFPRPIRARGLVIPNPILAELPRHAEGPRQPRVVNYCRLVPQKNLEMLIDAFGSFHRRFPAYALELYGMGPMEGDLRSRIAEAGLEGCAAVRPFQENIHEIVRDAAMYVSSSNFEGVSNSMLEALAMGLPTIATDCPPGGARSVIEDGVNGLLVPVGDTGALCEAMCRIASDPDLAESLSRNARRLGEALAPERIAGQWCDLIERVAGGGKAKGSGGGSAPRQRALPFGIPPRGMIPLGTPERERKR